MTLEEDNRKAASEKRRLDDRLSSWKPKTQLGRDVLNGG